MEDKSQNLSPLEVLVGRSTALVLSRQIERRGPERVFVGANLKGDQQQTTKEAVTTLTRVGQGIAAVLSVGKTEEVLSNPSRVTDFEFADEHAQATQKVTEELAKTDSWAHLMECALMDPMVAAMSVLSLAKQIVKILTQKPPKDEQEQRSRSEGLNQAVRGALEQAAGLQAGMSAARELEQLDQSPNEQGKSIPGGRQAGKHYTVPQFAAKEPSVCLDRNLLELFDLMGRARAASKLECLFTNSYSSGEMVDISFGSDLSKILPSALFKLEMNEDLFLLEMAEGRLPIQTVEASESAMGPVVMALDCSSSMDQQRLLWAKSMAAGLAVACAQQRRPFEVVAFNDAAWTIKPSDVLSLHASGGTSFDRAIEHCLSRMVKNAKVHHKVADLVVLTDGEDRVSPYTMQKLDAFRSRGMRTFGLQVDQSRTSSLTEWCDVVAPVDLHGDKLTVMRQVYRTIAKAKPIHKAAR